MSPTIEQLQAMQLQVRQGYAQLEHPRFVAAKALLDGLVEAENVAQLTQLAAELPESGAKTALANVAGAIQAARNLLIHEIPRVEAVLPAPPAPPAPPAE